MKAEVLGLGGPLSASPGLGWAANSVNGVIFRKNSLVSHGKWQYVAFYDPLGWLVLAKRLIDGADWVVQQSPYRAEVRDAHRSASLMVDGDGFVHVAWDHHDSPLRYACGVAPESLVLGTEQALCTAREEGVTYPEFYRLPGGDLLFLYRQGQSGAGNLVINRYSLGDRVWRRVHHVLIDGEGCRNAYWQACVESLGAFHVSWVWRESWDVASNHDLCYAKSLDGGLTWVDSRGSGCTVPISAARADYALRIPQGRGLMNQTGMCADGAGHPFIASYWTPQGQDVPQIHIVYDLGEGWRVLRVTDRTLPFSLGGGGTKKIPLSRPQVVARTRNGTTMVAVVFRDLERGSGVTIAVCPDLAAAARDGREGSRAWTMHDGGAGCVGDWEPSFDTELWASRGILDLFVQNMGQGDGEGLDEVPPQPVYVLRALDCMRLG